MTTDNRTNEPNQNETKSGQAFCFTEAQVEAAARAMAEVKSADYKMPVHLITEQVIGAYRPAARAALTAAQGAAPVLPSNTVDEDALAEVLIKHSPSASSTGGFAACRCDRVWRSTEENAAHIAHAVSERLKEQGR